MGSNKEKKLIKKEIKSDHFCYCKVVRAITKWGEKFQYFDVAHFEFFTHHEMIKWMKKKLCKRQ